MIRNKFKLRIKKQLPVEELDPTTCENCGHLFQGHFCPNCGQKVAEFDLPFGFIAYDFMGNFFAFDTRFFRSFLYLLFRPGFLSVEFFKGKRTRYSPPFRIFIFLSFVLFLMLQIITDNQLSDLSNSGDIKTGQQQKVNKMERDTSAINLNEKTQAKLNLKNTGDGTIKENLDKIRKNLEKQLQTTTDLEEKKELESYHKMLENPDWVVSKFLKYLSWAFFILLPVFALLLKLFYIRRKQYYVRHLIFSVHIHSYLFLILIIAISLYQLIDGGGSTIALFLFFSSVIYQIIAMKLFYGQSIPKVILKFIGINFIYNIFVFTAVIYVLVKSLGVA